jgi:hypothetical protein
MGGMTCHCAVGFFNGGFVALKMGREMWIFL